MISCLPVKFGGHRHPNSTDMIVFVCCHWFSFRDLVRLLERHFPDGRFPNQTHPRWTLPNQTNPRRHFLDQTHPRQTLPRPDTSPTDTFSTRNIPDTHTSPTRHIPDGHFPDQTHSRRTLSRTNKCSKTFPWLDASQNGHFPDGLNTWKSLSRIILLKEKSFTNQMYF